MVTSVRDKVRQRWSSKLCNHHVSLECRLHVNCEPVDCQLEL